MELTTKFSNVTKWLKIFTYISATVLLITNNKFDKLTYLIPMVLILFFVNYSRDYYLINFKKHMKFVVASIILEIILIVLIGFIDTNEFNILFYFVCISSIIISNPFAYSIPIVLIYIASSFYMTMERNGIDYLMNSVGPMFFSYGVSSAFVMVMSHLVKLQVREKDKLAHINAELEQAYKKLIENSSISEKLTVEQERTRMAREIHDTLAHTMTNLIVQLEACKKLANMDPSRLPGELEKAQELSRSGFNDIKRSIKALRPQVMEDKSFIAAINSIINDTMENTKVHINFNNFLPNEIKLISLIEITIFRVIQESITNSIRHGQADKIDISIKQDKNTLQLNITDNGIGCTNIKKGYGIQGIRERIETLQGSTEFSSSPGKGFKTTISIPYGGESK